MANKIIIKLLEARNLQDTDVIGKCDPYCILSLHRGKETFKSKVVKSTVNPVWNEEFTFHFENLNDVLRIRVYDNDTATTDDYLGELNIDLKDYFNFGWREEWKQLVYRQTGRMMEALTGHKRYETGQGQLHFQLFVGNGLPPAAPPVQIAALQQGFVGQQGQSGFMGQQQHQPGFVGGQQQPGFVGGQQQPIIGSGLESKPGFSSMPGNQPGFMGQQQQQPLGAGGFVGQQQQQPGFIGGQQQTGTNFPPGHHHHHQQF